MINVHVFKESETDTGPPFHLLTFTADAAELCEASLWRLFTQSLLHVHVPGGDGARCCCPTTTCALRLSSVLATTPHP